MAEEGATVSFLCLIESQVSHGNLDLISSLLCCLIIGGSGGGYSGGGGGYGGGGKY